MSQFVQRLANYLANEVLIKGLANSKVFQRWAVRTDRTLQDMQKNGMDQYTQAFSSMTQQQAVSKTSPPQPPLRGFSGFVSAFFREIRKDLGLGK